MPFQVSPGVNVSEIDNTGIIPGVSTTEAGHVGHDVWGPVLQRVLVDNEDTYVANFGKPNSNTYTDFFPAVNSLKYGNKLIHVRVVRSSNTSTLATDTVAARNAHTATANGKNTIIKNAADYENNYSSGISGIGNWVAKYPGVLGNTLRVSVCPSANAWQSTVAVPMVFTNNSVSVSSPRNGVGANALSISISIGDTLLAGPDRFPVRVATVSSNTLTLQSKYVGNTSGAAGLSSVQRRWEFFNQFDAAPGTSSFASVQSGTSDEMHIVVADEDGAITGVANSVIERFGAVSKASDAKKSDGGVNYYKEVINQGSRWIYWASALTGVTNSGSKAAGVSFGAGAQSKPINASFVRGRDGGTPRDADYINGFNQFANPEEVDVSFLFEGDGNLTRALHCIQTIAEVRKDMLAVVGPRRSDVVNNASYTGKEVDDTITFRDTLPSSSYGVMSNNYKYQYDKYNDVYRYVNCSGDVVGAMVYTDLTRDAWWSPAGYQRGQIKDVIKLAYNPTKAQRDQLYKKGINPIVTFPGQGTVLFGDKTLLTAPSAFDRINVRRLFIVLEKAISTAAKFMLFEFNDEFTRAQFRNLIEPFLRDVQGRRGIFDFKVICDETNNTPQVIDSNSFVGSILVKPARSINFMQLNFTAVRTGVEFTEAE